MSSAEKKDGSQPAASSRPAAAQPHPRAAAVQAEFKVHDTLADSGKLRKKELGLVEDYLGHAGFGPDLFRAFHTTSNAALPTIAKHGLHPNLGGSGRIPDTFEDLRTGLTNLSEAPPNRTVRYTREAPELSRPAGVQLPPPPSDAKGSEMGGAMANLFVSSVGKVHFAKNLALAQGYDNMPGRTVLATNIPRRWEKETDPDENKAYTVRRVVPPAQLFAKQGVDWVPLSQLAPQERQRAASTSKSGGVQPPAKRGRSASF